MPRDTSAFWSTVHKFLQEQHLSSKKCRLNSASNRSIITVQKTKELWSDCLHRLHLDIAPLSKFGFQSSVSVSNLSANQREKLVNFPLLTNDIVEQQVSSMWSTLNTMAGPGSCSGKIKRKKITHIKGNDSQNIRRNWNRNYVTRFHVQTLVLYCTGTAARFWS